MDETSEPMERYGHISELDRSFDREYWSKQSREAKWTAVWQMVVYAASRRGITEDELRLDRTIEKFGRQEH